MVGNTSYIKDVLGLSFDRHGVESGWCGFPLNYDPVWVSGECKLLKKYKNSLLTANVGTVGHIDHQKSSFNIKEQ